jgi:hypothetical protein
MEKCSELHAPAALFLEKNTGCWQIGSFLGPKTGLNVLQKKEVFCPYWDSIPIPFIP